MDRTIASRRLSTYAVIASLGLWLALPSLGWASSGGSGLTPSPPAGSGTGNPDAAVQAGNVTVSASGNGITLQTRTSALLRKGLSFSGTASASAAGDTIEIERSGHETDWRWAETVTATIAADGSFSALWQTNHIGRFSIRAVIASPALAQSAATTPSLTITVYRPSRATQYGPGFYGRRTACGQKLGPSTIGLANRTLKCGTSVALYYQGRTLIVPVIDRGPYANGADWDLTEATGRALGIGGTAEIGAVSLPVR
jgi:rare lipoprotein A (peptidoglycan hydrolase)